jgi:hypothetical protein
MCISIRPSGQTPTPPVTRSPHNPIAVPPSASRPPTHTTQPSCSPAPPAAHYLQSTYHQLTAFTYQSFTLLSNGQHLQVQTVQTTEVTISVPPHPTTHHQTLSCNQADPWCCRALNQDHQAHSQWLEFVCSMMIWCVEQRTLQYRPKGSVMLEYRTHQHRTQYTPLHITMSCGVTTQNTPM